MRIEAKHDIQSLTANNNWLFMHMITAFWHGFGMSNGLCFSVEDLITVTYKKGTPRKEYKVPAHVMQEHLKEYIRWLENYKKSWNTDLFSDSEKEDFYNDVESRKLIVKMIELLQI